MYRELLSAGAYDNANEYATLHALAKAEFEEEVAKDEYIQELIRQDMRNAENDSKNASCKEAK